VSRHQKGKTNLDFIDSEWQWHQLGHMQVCTSLQTDNHATTPPLSFVQSSTLHMPDALSAAQPTVENVALKLHPLATFSTLRSSYLDVELTTVHRLCTV